MASRENSDGGGGHSDNESSNPSIPKLKTIPPGKNVLNDLVRKTIHPVNEHFVLSTQQSQVRAVNWSDPLIIPDSQQSIQEACFDLGFEFTQQPSSDNDDITPSLQHEFSVDLTECDFQTNNYSQDRNGCNDINVDNVLSTTLNSQIEQDVDPSQLSQCSPIFGVTASQYVSAKQEKKNPEVLRIVQEEIDTFLHKMCSSQSISDFLSGKDDPVPIIKESRHAIRCQLEKLVSMKGGNIEILETVYDNYVTFQCKMSNVDEVLDYDGKVLPFSKQLASRFNTNNHGKFSDESYKQNLQHVLQASKISNLKGYSEDIRIKAQVVSVFTGRHEMYSVPVTEIVKRCNYPEFMSATALCRLFHRDTRDIKLVNRVKENLGLPPAPNEHVPYDRSLKTKFAAFTESESAVLCFDYGTIIDEVTQVHNIKMSNEPKTLVEALREFMMKYECTDDFDKLSHGAGPGLMGLTICAFARFIAPYLKSPLTTSTPGAENSELNDYLQVLANSIDTKREEHLTSEPTTCRKRKPKAAGSAQGSFLPPSTASSSKLPVDDDQESTTTVTGRHEDDDTDTVSVSDSASVADVDDIEDFAPARKKMRRPAPQKGKLKLRKRRNSSEDDIFKIHDTDDIETKGLKKLYESNKKAIRKLEGDSSPTDKLNRLKEERDSIMKRIRDRSSPDEGNKQSGMEPEVVDMTNSSVDSPSRPQKSTSLKQQKLQFAPDHDHEVDDNPVVTQEISSDEESPISEVDSDLERAKPNKKSHPMRAKPPVKGTKPQPDVNQLLAKIQQMNRELAVERTEKAADEAIHKKAKSINELIKECYREKRKCETAGLSTSDDLKEAERELQLLLETETYAEGVAFQTEIDLMQKVRSAEWRPKPVIITKHRRNTDQGKALEYMISFCGIKDESPSDNEIITIDDSPVKLSTPIQKNSVDSSTPSSEGKAKEEPTQEPQLEKQITEKEENQPQREKEQENRTLTDGNRPKAKAIKAPSKGERVDFSLPDGFNVGKTGAKPSGLSSRGRSDVSRVQKKDAERLLSKGTTLEVNVRTTRSRQANQHH